MKNKIYYLSVFILLTTLLTGCEEPIENPDTPFFTFESNSATIGVQEAGEATTDVKIYTANVTNSDRSIAISVNSDETTADPASYTVPPTVTIPAGSNEGILTIGFKDIELGVVNEDKILKLKLEETEENFVGEELEVTLGQLCPGDELKLKVSLSFDSWPEEVAWRILDSTGATVMQSSSGTFAYGAYTGMSGDFTAPAECLTPGTYTIQIFDQYGDGGTRYTVTSNGTTVYTLAADGYTTSAQASFSI